MVRWLILNTLMMIDFKLLKFNFLNMKKITNLRLFTIEQSRRPSATLLEETPADKNQLKVFYDQ